MNKKTKIIISVLIILVAVSFAKDLVIKVGVEKGVRIATGLPLKISSFRLGLARTLVGIKSMKLYNPKGFEDKIMLDMPEIYVDYHLTPVFRGKIHLQDMRINLKEFVVVKNKDGKVNLDSLKVVKEQKSGSAAERPAARPKKAGGKAPEMQIDSLELKIGKVIYKDYSKGAKPSVQEFNIGIDEKYNDIDSPQALITLIMVRAFTGTTIGRLANIDMKALQGSISDTLAGATEVVSEKAAEAKLAAEKAAKEAEAAAQKAAQEAEAAARKAAKNAEAALKKAAEEVKDKFKLPFGEN
jgi:hypothetical protein